MIRGLRRWPHGCKRERARGHRSWPVVAILVATVGTGVVPGTPARADAPRPTRETVLAMLSGVDSGPRPAEVATLGAGVVPILEALHRDAQLEPFVRARAVEALGWTRLPLAARSLRPIVERDPNPFFVRAALVAIARLEGTGAVPLIADRLGHPSSVVRMGAVEGLALVGTEAARHSLRARLSVERHAGVRRALERAIVRGPAAVARTRGVTSATQTATPNDAAKGRSRTREGH